jgi:hypothetical protein
MDEENTGIREEDHAGVPIQGVLVQTCRIRPILDRSPQKYAFN